MAPATRVSQYQDEHTAVTVTVAESPLVFARDFPLLAANARDYLNLRAIEVNRMGDHRYFLFGYRWSTIDRRGVMVQSESTVLSFELVADSRPIVLRMDPDAFRTAAVARMPWPAPTGDAIAVLYPSDRATLEFIAAAGHLVLVPEADSGGDATPYAIWPDQRFAGRGQVALEELLQRTGR